MRRTLAELASLLGTPPPAVPETTVTGAAIDSRAARPGDLFVAIPGERVDGHAFLADAAIRGAAAALVSHPVDHPLAQLVVPDTVAALQRLAAAERRSASYRLAAVTGSLAKTTTKELLATLMATTFRVGATRGSRNSQAGFPAELLGQGPSIDWFVAELGMSHAGELDRLGAVAQPDAAVYTVIAPVHLEYFADIEGIAAAKAELIPHLRPDGLLVLNAADTRVAALASRFRGRVVRYGRPGTDLWVDAFVSRGLLGASFVLRGPGLALPIDWSLPGRHQASNLAAAAACAIELGVPAARVAQAATEARPAAHRGEVHALANGVAVVDDSYNASPLAVRAALELLAETPGRHIAVLGEMLELGPDGPAFHAEVGRAAAAAADVVLAVGGPSAGELARAAGGEHLPDAAAAFGRLQSLLRPGDAVLVKGSRGIGLDRVVTGLLGETP